MAGSKWSLVFLGLHALSGCIYASWEVIDEGFKYIAIGPQGVYGLKSLEYGGIYYRWESANNSASLGTIWKGVGGTLSGIDIGNRVLWGVNAKNQLWRRDFDYVNYDSHLGSRFTYVSDQPLKYVSVSEKNHFWGIDPDGVGIRRAGATLESPLGDSWEEITGETLSQITVGSGGVWALTEDGKTIYREGTFGDVDTVGTSWIEVPGNMNQVHSDAGVVMGINNNDEIFYRSGMTESEPTGTEWVQMEGSLRQIDSWNGAFWGINSEDQLLGKLMDCRSPTE